MLEHLPISDFLKLGPLPGAKLITLNLLQRYE